MYTAFCHYYEPTTNTINKADYPTYIIIPLSFLQTSHDFLSTTQVIGWEDMTLRRVDWSNLM